LKKLKQAIKFITPYGIVKLLEENRESARPTRAEKAILSANAAFKDRHRGKRCFILGTGPSIKKQNLKALGRETCIAVSNFFVHRDFPVIRPRYYCVPAYHPPFTDTAWNEWIGEVFAKTNGSELFMGDTLLGIERYQERCTDIGADMTRTFFIKFGRGWNSAVRRGIDLTGSLPAPQSVAIMALMIALYLGFGEIYLLGCDHDWILHLGENAHFYDEKKSALYRSGHHEGVDLDLATEFRNHLILWEQYKALREIAERNNTRVFNATAGSLLDVFPRAHYDSILKRDYGIKR